ncbi:choice-of-anchor B family protein [Candidatus Amarolinea aalborgensis]|uniref:choice-of-anchor B family protein n=1 Tax=Candidatus Amarolinea aalborgensis TaxID=2249329 RepID=UPI003BF9DDBA
MQKLLSLFTVVFVLATATVVSRQPGQPILTDRVPCRDGFAAGFPCRGIDLLAQVSLAELGASGAEIKANKHWGWRDPQTGRDIVLFGLTNATSFVDITDREHPIVLGLLPSHQGVSEYRDMVVNGSYLYVVADTPAQHGLQVFDLTQLRGVPNPPVTFAESAHYAGFVAGHSLWMDQATGYLYVFRSVGDACQNGVHVVNVQNPLQPTFAGCFGQTDTPLSTGECLVYEGPDHDYHGHEVCFVGSDDNVSIFDVTNKSQPQQVANFTYPGIARAHQGDLTADRRYWLLGDMMDEHHTGNNTRTYAFDISDLDHPVVLGHFSHSTTAIDHDLLIVGTRVFEANWRAGLRILDISSLPGLDFREMGYFDTVPDSDSIGHTGAFAPYVWPDGAVTVSDTESGLFILRPAANQQYLPVLRVR